MLGKQKSSQYLKTCMADALLELMQTTPIHKITAQQIADRAGVGRATWFRAFSSKQEALVFKILSSWYSWCEQRNVKYPVKADTTEVLEFFRFSYSMRDTFTLLLHSDLQQVVLEAFFKIINEISVLHEGDPSTAYSASFYSFGMLGLMYTWIARDFRDTPEQLLELVRSIMAKGDLQ